MKHWLLFLSAILATGLTAVEGRAETPAFVRPGLAVTYSGTVNSLDVFQDIPSSQKITVSTVTSNPGNGIVLGNTIITNYLSPQYQNNVVTNNVVTMGNTSPLGLSCTENQACSIQPDQLGTIAQFWVDPSSPAASILEAKRAPYVQIAQCPVSAGIINLTCLNSLGNIPNPNTGVPAYTLRLGFDSTGFIRYFYKDFEPFGTFGGDAGRLTYTSRMTIPWQVDNSSIVFQHDTGPVAVWEMNGTTPSAFGSSIPLSPDWRVVGTGDFYQDGLFDVLFQNANGLIAIWEIDGTTRKSTGEVATPPRGWRVAAVGDFDGDGHSDILFQHSTGAIAVWTNLTRGTTPNFGNGYYPSGQGWHVVGTGDFNMPRKSDILWQHDSGVVAIWEMNGTTPSNEWIVKMPNGQDYNPGPGWYALGSGHFYGGDNCDILLQHSSGLVAVWEVIGHTLTGRGGNLPNPPGPAWHVVGVGDYNGDHSSDILWQHDSGVVAVWTMNGINPIVEGNGIAPPAGWNP
jgi:hypothetical protein